MIFEREARKSLAKVAKRKLEFFRDFCASFASFAFRKSA